MDASKLFCDESHCTVMYIINEFGVKKRLCALIKWNDGQQAFNDIQHSHFMPDCKLQLEVVLVSCDRLSVHTRACNIRLYSVNLVCKVKSTVLSNLSSQK